MFALLRDNNLLKKKRELYVLLTKNNKINRQEKESTKGIRRGGMPPGSPNPGSKSCFFPHPFPDLSS